MATFQHHAQQKDIVSRPEGQCGGGWLYAFGAANNLFLAGVTGKVTNDALRFAIEP